MNKFKILASFPTVNIENKFIAADLKSESNQLLRLYGTFVAAHVVLEPEGELSESERHPILREISLAVLIFTSI